MAVQLERCFLETKAFAELGLSPKVLAAVEASGYTIATPIQSAAIPIAIAGRDVLGIAQTGTGKTAAFTLPMITRLETGRARARMPRSLILAPTRELAAQVAQAFEKYGVNHKLTVALLIGGVSMDDQTKKLDRGVDVLIATPGRLLDHFQRGRVMMMGVEILVIDEADRMLDMGFIPDIEKICKLLPAKKQTLFFSATMPAEITRLVNTFLKDPVRVEAAKPATTAKTITQRFKFCPDGEDYAKREILRELIKTGNVKNAIIFCNRKRDVAVLHKSLSKHGFNAGALHGDMDQKSRTETLDKFRNGEIMLLAASDVAARGLDIPDVLHVFNFDLPWAADDYVHRIGRTGRAGKEGNSASLVSPDDLKFVKDIEKITGEAAVWMGDPPTDDDIAGAGKRRRGRGGKAAPERGQSARAAPSSGRGEPRGPSKPASANPAPRGERRPETRAPRPERSPETVANDAAPLTQPLTAAERPRREAPRRVTEQPVEASAAAVRSSQSAMSDRRETRPHSSPKGERQPRHDSWTDDARGANREQPGDRAAERGGERDGQRSQARGDKTRGPASKPSSAQMQGGDRLGFAENVPAFMRKPSRPAKVPGRG
ncbi:MAG: DEAD/DEAH box helicase [Hyphomicrobium sp.]|nr:DEAD/DEAH box helicase [Hyphomicrobium sp.]